MIDIELRALEHAQNFEQVALVVRMAAEIGVERVENSLPIFSQHGRDAL